MGSDPIRRDFDTRGVRPRTSRFGQGEGQTLLEAAAGLYLEVVVHEACGELARNGIDDGGAGPAKVCDSTLAFGQGLSLIHISEPTRPY